MDIFPRTTVGGVSLPRIIIGSNWFLGYSHSSLAKDRLIRETQTRQSMADVLCAFLDYGIDAVMAPLSDLLEAAIQDAEQRSGRAIIRILTPSFDLKPGGDPAQSPEAQLDRCAALKARFCLPHQCVTDALVDRREGVIRDLDHYSRLIRERGMIPGLSTHMPESVVYADRQGADVETYIQIYNAAGFLMQVEADWVMRIIANAHKPVITIKPLAAGRLLPAVGLAFAWSTIRAQDMVTLGVSSPDEAREDIEISLALLNHEIPGNPLQSTRSKAHLKAR